MTDQQCVEFLQWALPQLRLRWRGFRKVRRQVHKRIYRRLAELGLVEVSEYRSYLEAHAAEWSVLDGFCRISISRFYRDRAVFDHLGGQILPALARLVTGQGGNEVRAWSAGCGCGEEAYSLAILWSSRVAESFPGCLLRLVATDVDEQMLARARRARYPASSLKEVPRDWLDLAFTFLGEEEEQYELRPQLAAGVEFRRQDIRTEMPEGPFHLAMCRHLVFTYFDEELQREILRQIVRRVTPDGVLVTGKQEPLPSGTVEVAPDHRRLGIYRIADLLSIPTKSNPAVTVCYDGVRRWRIGDLNP